MEAATSPDFWLRQPEPYSEVSPIRFNGALHFNGQFNNNTQMMGFSCNINIFFNKKLL